MPKRMYRKPSIGECIIMLVTTCDFEKMPHEQAEAIYASMPSEFKRVHEEKDRELIGMYEVYGDEMSHLYFLHSYNHDDGACSCALIMDTTKDTRMPKIARTWAALNPHEPVVRMALDYCSETIHEDEDEDHPNMPESDNDSTISIIYL